MTFNLEAEADLSIDPTPWTALQVEICMNVANAKFYAFIEEAEKVADLVRLGLLSRTTGADYLDECAVYNGLYFKYGRDRIQGVMSAAFAGQAAA